MSTLNSCTLYCTDNGSDKVYMAAIETKDDGYIVTFAYGPRGGTMKPGVKTPAPVPQAKAQKVYDTLVQSKMAKGYTPGAAGTPFMATDKEERFTGICPQLLNPITGAELERYFGNPLFWAQEKFDGKRVTLRRENGQAYGINRKGLNIGIPVTVGEALLNLPGTLDLTLDAELIGSVAYIFDIRMLDGRSVESLPYSQRLANLKSFVLLERSCLIPVETAKTEQEKRVLFYEIAGRHGEGIVFKNRTAEYTAGRPSSYGPQLKFKFTETATCRVWGFGDKRSVQVTVLGGFSGTKQVGWVTIPPNYDIPEEGDLVEVRYLYVGTRGALYQPNYQGVRDDKSEPDTWESLKQKPSVNDDEDDS